MQLFRYSEAIGLPVICADSGKRAGMVKDVFFNPQERLVAAFLMERKGVEVSHRQILFGDVLGIGRDALIIDKKDLIAEISREDRIDGLNGEKHLLGLHVFEKSGSDVGVVKDVIFDIGTGRIESVEVSDGIIQDLVQGRQILPLFGKVEFGAESIIVEKEAVDEMVNNGGGIKNRLLS